MPTYRAEQYGARCAKRAATTETKREAGLRADAGTLMRTITEALRAFPEARAAVIAAVRRVEASSA
jgi:hypothetical protein